MSGKLKRAGVSQAARDDFLRDFHDGIAANRIAVAADMRVFGLMVEVLDLLSARYGQWRLGDDRSIRFDSEDDTETFYSLLDEVDRAKAKAAAAHHALIEQMRSQGRSE